MKCGVTFDLSAKTARIVSLKAQLEKEEAWNDYERIKAHNQELSQLERLVSRFEKLSSKLSDAEALIELISEEQAKENSDEYRELKEILESAERELEREKTFSLLSGENDQLDAIVSIHAGAGGTESQDWVDMLSRMYLNWAKNQGMTVKIVDRLAGEEAGTKSLTFEVSGEFAYGMLKGEHGVHRLVRISPFDANKRRHTSFAAVDVIPEIKDESEIEISEEDLQIETFRASGAGGQHVNKTSSAVRITHKPTGIVVSCQNERSQHLNRLLALRVLYSRLVAIKQEEKKQLIEGIRGTRKDMAWGNQIRSYVLHPYQLVKDLRTNYETSNAERVLNGEINDFIFEYLKWRKFQEDASRKK